MVFLVFFFFLWVFFGWGFFLFVWLVFLGCFFCQIPELWLLEPSRHGTVGKDLSPSSWGHLRGLVVSGQPCPHSEGLEEPPSLCKGGICSVWGSRSSRERGQPCPCSVPALSPPCWLLSRCPSRLPANPARTWLLLLLLGASWWWPWCLGFPSPYPGQDLASASCGPPAWPAGPWC